MPKREKEEEDEGGSGGGDPKKMRTDKGDKDTDKYKDRRMSCNS
jgi:hypothetical protein